MHQLPIDTLTNNINYLFNQNWKCYKTATKLSYKHTTRSLDEYVFDINEDSVNVSVPLDNINYKTRFSVFELNNAINYIKMQVSNYH